ncbi:UV excision repair protein RAD23 [Parastagonospora nodorum]|uniref:UV excision repair protein RAD23 n=1 Tax=Phaeosphaeria nodorum (strain SN15 / ATCC MYA-4574 / FGSC 10173) TaxID=321614 RepID=A0A7U2I1L9_PHANO|nr:UV excision repair protein RAD23 [Parastagonospora nodorum]QRC96421.1 UV excision repair protein RAD23 [Parastagonospora nodorum SN15]KAH3926351.1 UV excision repair protein RAD23 [Parastagonospora nodorum]KAH4007999.1 UV excision repair protein RAD23 [Parastagonospora nodorum]KAH4023498.1 UV excision repair protein RAD23 [Parastagonospora nodorum]
MKITFKDLKQNKFVIEAEPSETIGELKAKIQADKGWEVPQQKLIYSGKILQDANTVESYSIEEKGFIVCMVSKPKAPAASSSKAPPSTPAPAAAQTPAAPAAPAPLSAVSQNAPATPSPAPATQATGRNFDDPSALTMGNEREAAVANMESMGFARADIDAAMRAAFFNPDRAVEYLLTGIPDSARQEQAQAAQANAPSSPTPAAGGNTGATAAPSGGDEPINLFEAAAQAGQRGGSGGAARSGATGAAAGAGGATALNANSLEFLRNNPQFQQLRQVVQQQPQMLEPILQQVGAGNPQLAQMIAANPEQFLQLLAEDADDDAPLPPGTQAISVTEDEREAIERLCRLGFERDIVIQAYFACDKNEELAANFLFDQPDEEE